MVAFNLLPFACWVAIVHQPLLSGVSLRFPCTAAGDVAATGAYAATCTTINVALVGKKIAAIIVAAISCYYRA